MKKIKVLENNIKALKNYHSKKTFLNNMPTYFWLEPTNNCNLQCIMCPTGAGKVTAQKGYMDYDFYRKIIDEISAYASAITMAVAGESLLHPRFFDMVNFAANKGIKVILNTNAVLLDKDKARLMLDSGINSISFAFDGYTKSMYEKARRGADYEGVLGNILYFLKLKKQNKKKLPYTVLSMLMLGLGPCQEREKQTFLKQFSGLVDEVRLREVSTWGNTFKEATGFSFRKIVDCYPPCSRLWSTAVITWNGNVIPCIYDSNQEYVIGNLRKEKFCDIWNSPKMLALRRSMIDNTYLKLSPLCEHCIVLGVSAIIGIPSGIRLTLADAITNFLGYRFEKMAIYIANILKKEKFVSKTIT